MNIRPNIPLGGHMERPFLSSLLFLVLLIMLQTVPFSMGAVQGPEVVSGSRLTLDDHGHIEGFTVWIEFPEPLDIVFCTSHVRLFVYGKEERSIDGPDFQYEYSWSMDNRTLTISSGDAEMSDEDIFSFTVSISLPLRTDDGDMLWEDSQRTEIELTFGNADDFDPGYGPFDILRVFILPFVLMVFVLIATEVVLRLTVKARDVDKVMSTTETLLKLIERTERMLRIRLVITLLIVSVLIIAYVSLMALALVSFTLAMVMTWAAIFYLSPWAILVVTTVLYLIFRREDLVWRKRLEHLRDQQRKFLHDLDKE